jgi:hypothetical protein
MRAPRWVLALASLATAGSVACVVGLPAGSAAVGALGRIEVSARGDAMYFEVNSASIPASPTNNASSLYMETQLSSTGGGTATASTPFFGSTVQNLPGTANGVPPQFGFKDVAFPFTRLPGYITCRDNGEETGQFGYGRVQAKCGQGSSEAHGSQGAPPEIPAPNQQETADAVTRITEDGAAVAEASGTVKGFVMGPLEVGNAIATATIRSTAGNQPEIKSSTSGTFSVNDQKFGFTENGIVFAGEGMSQQDALKQANEALEAAGIRIEVAPVTKSFDEASGRTSYTIGGLKITSTQQDSQLVYTLCRASITSVNDSSGASLDLDTIIGAEPSETTAATEGAIDSGPSAGGAPGTGADVGTDSVDSGSSSPSFSSSSFSSPSFSSAPTSGSTSDSTATATAPVPDPAPASEAALAPPAVGPTTLGGFRPTSRPLPGHDTEWLYLLIILGGVAVFGGQAALSRFAVTRG